MAQSAATSSFEWRGASHPVRHERVRVALHAAAELAAALDAPLPAAMDVDGEGGSGGGERLAAFDRAINALSEARAAVRALAKANAGEARSPWRLPALRVLCGACLHNRFNPFLVPNHIIRSWRGRRRGCA